MTGSRIQNKNTKDQQTMIKNKEQYQSATLGETTKNNNKETGSRIKNKKQKQQNGIIKNIHKINDENGKQTTTTKGNHHV